MNLSGNQPEGDTIQVAVVFIDREGKVSGRATLTMLKVFTVPTLPGESPALIYPQEYISPNGRLYHRVGAQEGEQIYSEGPPSACSIRGTA